MTAREVWEQNRAGVSQFRTDVPHADLNRIADEWTAFDAGMLLRCFHVGRWSPETRALIFAARKAVDAALRAMTDERTTR